MAAWRRATPRLVAWGLAALVAGRASRWHPAARELRRDATLRATRLVALSGYAQPEDRQRAREAGFDAHVAKPADLDALRNVLANGG